VNILWPVLAALAAFLVAYRFYPAYIARAFREDDNNPTPADRFADGRDYVKSRVHVVFAHHFSTIAGAGPIVGPTLALAFGWQPVWLWVVLGGIFFGAVHDMSALFASLREGGKTVGEIARRTLGPTGYLLNLVVLIFVLTIINAIFLNLSITALTSVYPLTALQLPADQTLLGTVVEDGITKARIGGIATTSVFIITAFAPLLGWLIRNDRITTPVAYLISGIVCVASVALGFAFPITMDGETWRWVMTAYIFLACGLPVWLILHPRDFTNVQILYGGQLLLLISLIVGGLQGTTLQQPAADIAGGEAIMHGAIWPLLFITVACGAISGFHSLVASGTTVKALPRESDARRVGYGAMLVESLLAVMVLMAVASMLPRAEYLAVVYPMDARGPPLHPGGNRGGARHPHGRRLRRHDAGQRRSAQPLPDRRVLELRLQRPHAGGAARAVGEHWNSRGADAWLLCQRHGPPDVAGLRGRQPAHGGARVGGRERLACPALAPQPVRTRPGDLHDRHNACGAVDPRPNESHRRQSGPRRRGGRPVRAGRWRRHRRRVAVHTGRAARDAGGGGRKDGSVGA
jgi:hypothetical protein